MRSILLALPFLASACIDGSRDGSTTDSAETADAPDTRDASEVDTGGVTCGKCVQVWHTETVFFGSSLHHCVIDNETGAQCCPTRGDTNCCGSGVVTCPSAGYEWHTCEDVREAFGRVFCADDDAYVNGGKVSQRGALCTTEETGCSGATLPGEP